MTAGWIEKVTGSLADKRRYRAYKARIAALPGPHRQAAEAIERYLMVFPPSAGSDLVQMLDDLADLFEQSVADGVRVRDIVGEDPSEFVETFLRNYPAGQWITKERTRLTQAIDRAAADEGER